MNELTLEEKLLIIAPYIIVGSAILLLVAFIIN